MHDFGSGKADYVGACRALSYLKDAGLVPMEFKERYPSPAANPDGFRRCHGSSSSRIRWSRPGAYDAPAGTALVLANFTYRPIEALTVRLPLTKPLRGVARWSTAHWGSPRSRPPRRFGDKLTARSLYSRPVWDSTTSSCSNQPESPRPCRIATRGAIAFAVESQNLGPSAPTPHLSRGKCVFPGRAVESPWPGRPLRRVFHPVITKTPLE